MKEAIIKIISSITPFDDMEKENISNAIEWVKSGVEIFRIEKPAIPPKHLVSYFVLIDQKERKIMLVDHLKAELWLPAGGHVEKDEHPSKTVEREIVEELNMPADYINEYPFFITQNLTQGKLTTHTDVSLWYLLKADSTKEIKYDPEEFKGYKWHTSNEILSSTISIFDPQMHRFVNKLLKSKII
jgi:8-oxo-dGTP pyrophosphatase MutT (NUDIX family)